MTVQATTDPEVPSSAEADEKAEEAAFAASFEDAAPTDHTPPDRTPEQDAPPPTAEEPPPVVPASATMTQEQLEALLAKSREVDTLKGAMEKQFGTAFGKLGGLERTLRELQSATPAGQAISISEDDFQEMKQEFPELLKMTVSGLNRALGKIKGTASPDADALDAKLREEVSSRVSAVRQDLAIDVLDGLRDDWRTVVTSTEYRTWLEAQPEDYRNRINASWKPNEVHQSIKQFEQAKTVPVPTPKEDPQKTASRRDRLAAAVPARGTPGGGPAVESEDDAFVKGFRAARHV